MTEPKEIEIYLNSQQPYKDRQTYYLISIKEKISLSLCKSLTLSIIFVTGLCECLGTNNHKPLI